MIEQSKKLAGKLIKESQKTIDFFSSLNPSMWELVTYSDGAAWNVIEVLSHIVEAEKSLGQLIHSIVTTGIGVPEDFDLQEFNERKVRELENKESTSLINNFKIYRQKNIDFLVGLEDDVLSKVGSHPFFGEAMVSEMYKMIMIHITLHIRDIRKLR